MLSHICSHMNKQSSVIGRLKCNSKMNCTSNKFSKWSFLSDGIGYTVDVYRWQEVLNHTIEFVFVWTWKLVLMIRLNESNRMNHPWIYKESIWLQSELKQFMSDLFYLTPFNNRNNQVTNASRINQPQIFWAQYSGNVNLILYLKELKRENFGW